MIQPGSLVRIKYPSLEGQVAGVTYRETGGRQPVLSVRLPHRGWYSLYDSEVELIA